MNEAENERQVGRTLSRADLRQAIYKVCPFLSRGDVKQLFDDIVEEITEALLCDETVKLREFGTFKVQSKRARVGRNPKTLVEAVIAPRRVLAFKPSPVLVEQLNGNRMGTKPAGA